MTKDLKNYMYNLIQEEDYVNQQAVDISQFPPEIRQLLNARLTAGLDLFGWRHLVQNHGNTLAFVIANDCVAGRGLRYANWTPCPKGVYLTTMPGDIVKMEAGIEPQGDAFKWLISKKQKTFLILHPPTWDALGNLINTSDGSTGLPNNCRLQYKPGNNYVNIISTRTIFPGDELLVPYGSKFTGDIRSWLKTDTS